MKNMQQWVRDVIEKKQRLVIPIMTHPGIELIGKRVLDAVTNGEVHAQAIIKLNEVYPADACTVIMDLTVEAEAFNATVKFSEDEVPSVLGRLVDSYEAVEKLKIPTLDEKRIPEYLKANRGVIQSIQDKPVLGGCIGPFSLAGRLYDMTEIMMDIYIQPETILLLLEKCTAFLISYCQAIKSSGVHGVIIAEPAAGLISNDDCVTYSSRFIKRIVDAVQDETFMVILHNCGNTGHCTSAMLRTGAMGYHFGNKIDLLEVLKECPEQVLVMGNIDPVGVIKQASPERIKEVIRELVKNTSQYSNFILSTGCDVPPHVPLQNIAAFYEAAKEH